MKDYYRSFLVRDYGNGALLSTILKHRLEELQEAGWQIVSATPHVVNRGKSNEYLEYIIVATAEIAEKFGVDEVKIVDD